MNKLSLLGVLFLLICGCSKEVTKKISVHNQWNDRPEMDIFIDSLMTEMTLEEKIGQTVLFASWWDITGPVSDNDFVDDAIQGKVGAVFNALTADFIYRMQKEVVEKSRLGIPLLFGYDVIHGYRTTFPTPFAMSASWDLDQIEKSCRVAAVEAAADGLNWTFAPMVDIARDPRWGRIAEGAGEDPYLGSLIAAAQVRGFQGTDLSDEATVLACAKHFAAYGAAQAGRDYHTVDISERVLRDVYLPPFKAACDAGVATYMTAFNELDGTPCSAHEHLLNDILKEQWGFDGFVVTDYTSIKEMVNHGSVADEKEAGEASMNAGVDMDMQSGIFMNHLKQSVEEGKVKEATVNEACRRILEMKYRLGLFEDPYRYCRPDEDKQSKIKSPEHFALAHEMARKSIVLLKNEDQLLPLNKEQLNSIALIGPMTDEQKQQLGAWHTTGQPETVTTILTAFKEKLGSKTKIYTAKGCDWEGDDRSGFAEALAAAKKAEVVVMCMGERENMGGEAASRVHIDIPLIQKELIKEVYKTGKPIVLLLHNGRPLTITWENEHLPAILECWHLGSMAGPAIADVVFGDYNPSGKLTATFPQHLGQVPIHYNMKNTGRPYNPKDHFTTRYQDCSNDPLYCFGYGLSYSSFEYSAVTLDTNTLTPDGKITASVKVTNTSNVDGEEVVQLYIRDLVGSVTRPVKELKGFQKVMIPANTAVDVSFEVSVEDLAFWRKDMSYGAEKGEFLLFIGTNSDVEESVKFELCTDADVEPYGIRK
ncbi:glycoside hydrolase family 3 N-terminal domain-containing protein [Carboxylicivirga taeanensis]|uniref:glycoside hydrolase family 3 N-terminal domain-containing protein n=1 Tax=Carboxylicivirga taeanensis TaxID=1416875 RepID=UPI003F6E27A7